MSLDAIKLSDDALEFNDAPAQVWMRVRDAEKLIYSRNPKRHDFGALITSLARYGYQETAKYDATLRAIKAGNGRIEALAKMERDGKYALPRGLAKHRDSGEWCLPILMGTDAPSETEALAYLVDANNITMLGGDLGMHEMARMWEDDIYAGILKDLQEAELPPVSMDHDDITAFLNTLENGNGLAANDDDHAGELADKAEELQKKWQVQLGDLWECGEHRIVCGDCTHPETIKKLMQNEKAALIHADPPYGMGKENEGIANDNLYGDKLDRFQMQWWKSCRPYIEGNASAYIWGNAEDLWRLWYVGGLKDSERLTFRSQIIWDKPPSASSYGSPIGSEKMRSFPHGYEVAFLFMLGEQGFNNNADNYWEGWEPIRLYLEQERKKAGWDIPAMKRAVGHSDLSRDHWTGKSQWSFPPREVYEKMQSAANGHAFKREYDELKREYDELKREYDELKREFYSTRAYFDNTHDNMTDVWKFPRVTGEERFGHATPKPLDLVKRAVLSSCPTNKITFVPFAGTAPELIACEQLKRRCRGIEINPAYVAVALERWFNLTKIEPQIIS